MERSKNSNQRSKLFVKKAIQGALAIRTVLYWFFCLCTIFLFVAISTLFSGNLQSTGEMFSGLWKQYSTAVLASVLLLPFVIWDVIKFSHRVVGPLIRLRNEMRNLASGAEVQPIRFRKDDYWHELADEFNRIILLNQDLRAKKTTNNELEKVS